MLLEGTVDQFQGGYRLLAALHELHDTKLDLMLGRQLKRHNDVAAGMPQPDLGVQVYIQR